jgi:hypothetical protein
MNRPLILLGAALILIGALVLGMTAFSRAGGSENRVPGIGEDQGRAGAPGEAWIFVSGLTLAAGAACVGVGMNRWRHNHGATPPGDVRHGT